MYELNGHDIRSFAAAIMHRCDQPKRELLDGKVLKFHTSQEAPKFLVVAHCDTVFGDIKSSSQEVPPSEKSRKKRAKKKQNDNFGYYTGYDSYDWGLEAAVRDDDWTITSGALDDRLGVCIALDILPQILPGVPFDVLLTDDEETGASTAAAFMQYAEGIHPTPEQGPVWEKLIDKRMDSYQFIAEFDRMGTDLARYDFNCSSAESIAESCGWELSRGSFTDICKMYDLGLWGGNFGVGYHQQHSLNCYVDLKELWINLTRFMMFVDMVGDKVLYHTEKKYGSYKSTGTYSGYNSSYTPPSGYNKEAGRTIWSTKQKKYLTLQESLKEKEEDKDREHYLDQMVMVNGVWRPQSLVDKFPGLQQDTLALLKEDLDQRSDLIVIGDDDTDAYTPIDTDGWEKEDIDYFKSLGWTMDPCTGEMYPPGSDPFHCEDNSSQACDSLWLEADDSDDEEVESYGLSPFRYWDEHIRKYVRVSYADIEDGYLLPSELHEFTSQQEEEYWEKGLIDDPQYDLDDEDTVIITDGYDLLEPVEEDLSDDDFLQIRDRIDA